MPLSHEDLVFLDDEQRPLNSSSIRVEPDLLVGDVADNRDFFGDLVASAKVLDALKKVIGVVVRSEPVAVDEDFDVFASLDLMLIPLFELLDSKIFQDGDKATD